MTETPDKSDKPESLDEHKAAIRTEIKARLADMTSEGRHEASVRACMRLVSLDQFESATTVMLYMPLVTEVDLTPAALRCFQAGRTVCVPRVDSGRREMVPIEVTSFDDHHLEIDEHGVRAPIAGRPVSPAMIDVIVVPGLAFDAEGHRLGRGGGYYDRFLSKIQPGTIKIGICFDAQMIDAVPVNEQDVPMNTVVTDRRLTYVDPDRRGGEISRPQRFR